MGKNQIEKWIETRMENLIKQQEKIVIKHLMQELSGFFEIKRDEKNIKKLKTQMEKIRTRVLMRKMRHKEIARKLSHDIRVDIALITRWSNGGLIDLGKRHEIEKLKKLIIERDYYMFVNPSNIQQDIKKNLWGD